MPAWALEPSSVSEPAPPRPPLSEDERRQRWLKNRENRRRRQERHRRRRELVGQLVLRPEELFQIFRLPVLMPLPLPCEACAERHQPGPERKQLANRLRQANRYDWQRAYTPACSIPCTLLEQRLERANPCKECPHRLTCRSACHLLDKLIPKSDPLYFDEIPTEPTILSARTMGTVEGLDLSRWRWADIADELRVHLQSAINERLTEPQRTAMAMHLDGMSGVQIARHMHVSKVTVHWYLKRARRRIVAFMSESPSAWRSAQVALERVYPDPEDL